MSEDLETEKTEEETKIFGPDPFIRDVGKRVSEMNIIELLYMSEVLREQINYLHRKCEYVWNTTNPSHELWKELCHESSAIKNRLKVLRPAFIKNKRNLNVKREDKYLMKRFATNRHSFAIPKDAYRRKVSGNNKPYNEAINEIAIRMQKDAAISEVKKKRASARENAKGFEMAVYYLNDLAQAIVDKLGL